MDDFKSGEESEVELWYNAGQGESLAWALKTGES